jgi:mannose-6-phosphate isomerase-like protein (cupin superfamily)
MKVRFDAMQPGQMFLHNECLCTKLGKVWCMDNTVRGFSFVVLSGLDEDDRAEIRNDSFDLEEISKEYDAVWISEESHARHEKSDEFWLVYRGALIAPVDHSKRMTRYCKIKPEKVVVLHAKMDSLSPVRLLSFESPSQE